MIVSLTIVRYKKAYIPFALLAMALHRLPLIRQKGCTFWKLLGTGRNGTFDLNPDWQQWGLLAVWNTRADFDHFYQTSSIISWWKRFTTESYTILCTPLQSHGKWNSKEPFGQPKSDIPEGPIAVLTRATIRLNKLKSFWGNVDSVASLMAAAPGYITSIGIGEAPVYRQATFSVWRSAEDMKAFAYGSKEHAEVIKKTRQQNWYSEELFARFSVIESFGTLNGKNPLQNYNTHESNCRTTASRF
jgi:heme-degrading monooxygenase HmoA